MAGPAYTPSAGAALYPNFVGQQTQDSVAFTNYTPAIATAADIPYKVQNEILAHQKAIQALVNGVTAPSMQNIAAAGSIAAFGAAALFNWQSFG